MRTQYMPLALCLLLMIFAANPTAFAKKSNNATSTVTINKSTVKVAKNTIKFPTIEKDGSSIINTETSTSATTIGDNSTNSSLLAFASIEENSYNSVLPTMATSATNFSAATPIVHTASQSSIFQQGLFYGFAFMVVLLNFVCFFLFEEKIFLYFSVTLAGITALSFFSDGLPELIGFEATQYQSAIVATLFLGMTAVSAFFASKFLTLSEFMPKVKWISVFALSVNTIIVFSAWLSETDLLSIIANSVSLSVLCLYFVAGTLLFSKKNYAKFYVIAHAVPLLFIADYFVISALGIDFLATEAFHVKGALVVEMLIMTYAIMYRMKTIKEENELRQTEMRIFLKRQEMMNRRNVEKLMEDVYLENLIMHYDLDGLEIKLLQYISEGKDNAKIARKLKTTESDIEELTKELYQKLEIGEHIQQDYRMVEEQPDYIYN